MSSGDPDELRAGVSPEPDAGSEASECAQGATSRIRKARIQKAGPVSEPASLLEGPRAGSDALSTETGATGVQSSPSRSPDDGPMRRPPGQRVMEEYGLTAEHVADESRRLVG